MNKEEIKKILPHREPMLLVDEVELIDGKAFGTMLLGLPDDPNDAAKALSYIRSQPNVSAEEVEYHG